MNLLLSTLMKNGGKFLYCENINEVYDFLQQILEENKWKEKSALLLNNKLKKKFKDFDWNTTEVINEGYFLFTTCEYLIANDGSILISSNQIAEKKLNELPKNFIVFATTSQIVKNIGEGLHGIKAKNKKIFLQTLQPLNILKPLRMIIFKLR